MKNNAILVLADPSEPQVAMLYELRPSVEVVVGNSPVAFENAAAGASVLFNWSGSLDLLRDVVAISPKLQWVSSRAVGLDKTLFPALIENPIILTNGRGVFSASLGEFALGAILYFAKDFRRMIRNQVARRWEQFDVTAVSGQAVGIVGYGDIGQAVAVRARALGMKILALRRQVSRKQDPVAEQIYSPDRRLEMLSLCDYVVVATPLTAETRGMIGESEFAVMKPNAVIINVGRGPIIQENALLTALSAGRIKGAALDVFDEEPLPREHPFYAMENVLLSPHCADHTSDWLEQSMRLFIEQYRRFSSGEPLLYVVDKKLGY